MVDMLRYLKDYTQRYMTATRDSDMDKITENKANKELYRRSIQVNIYNINHVYSYPK